MSDVMFPKNKRLKSKKLTDSARGKPCTVRIVGVCNNDSSTTVFAHLNGAGMGLKASDIHGCYACSSCHNWLDNGYTRMPNAQPSRRDLVHLRAMVETQQIMINEGLIKV